MDEEIEYPYLVQFRGHNDGLWRTELSYETYKKAEKAMFVLHRRSKVAWRIVKLETEWEPS